MIGNGDGQQETLILVKGEGAARFDANRAGAGSAGEGGVELKARVAVGAQGEHGFIAVRIAIHKGYAGVDGAGEVIVFGQRLLGVVADGQAWSGVCGNGDGHSLSGGGAARVAIARRH